MNFSIINRINSNDNHDEDIKICDIVKFLMIEHRLKTNKCIVHYKFQIIVVLIHQLFSFLSSFCFNLEI